MRLLSATTVAAHLNTSVWTFYRMVKRGQTPAPVKCGGRTLWREEEIRDWIEARCPHDWQRQKAAEKAARATPLR